MSRLVWECPNCQKINDFTFSEVCTSCRQPRPSDVTAHEADSTGPSRSQSKDFSTLDSVGAVVSGLGWALVIVSALAGLASLTGASGDLSLILLVPAALFACANGFALVAYGQLARCIVSINHNTKKAAALLEQASTAGGASAANVAGADERSG